MDLFPAILISQISLLREGGREAGREGGREGRDSGGCLEVTDQVIQLFVFAVSGVVFAEGPHEDHADQPHQEDDHHE